MKECEKQLLQILGCGLRGSSMPLPDSLCWPDILRAADRHSVSGALGYTMQRWFEQVPLDGQTKQALRSRMLWELTRSVNQEQALEELKAEFERSQIFLLPLKGSMLKRRYPRPEMRSMNDLDLLVKPAQHRQVRSAMNRLGYGGFQPGRKHDHYTKPPYIVVEAHRILLAPESTYSWYFEDIWSRCRPAGGCQFVHEMTLEDEYVFCLLHMIEHLLHGGIGIRFFMDVYVYEQLPELNRSKLTAALDTLGIFPFYQHAVHLAQTWFDVSDPVLDPAERQLVEELGAFVLDSGTYGSVKNRSAATGRHGRLRYLMKSCFPTLKSMQSMYPWLTRAPVLLPAAWLMRGVTALTSRRRNVQSVLHAAGNADQQTAKALTELYQKIGLHSS